MQEFDNLLNYCVHQFENTPFCSKCMMSQCRRCNTNKCYNCLKHIHSINTKDEHYSCNKITFNYILKHGYRYVSEMIWAFGEYKKMFDSDTPIRIVSVGCGPSTELYGAAAVFHSTHQIIYNGFDLSHIWQPIQQFNINNFDSQSYIIKYHDCDFIKYVKDNDVQSDILVLNYFLSDFVKYNTLQDCDVFINDLVCLLQEFRFKLIIINDVMLLYDNGTGYACMEKIARKLNLNQFSLLRRHFAKPNQWQFEYGKKHDDRIFFKPIIPEILPYEPFETCGSIQLIIKCN